MQQSLHSETLGLPSVGDRMHVRVHMPKATEELVLNHRFKPKQWQHVVVSHSAGSALVQPVVRLFVDGSPEANGRLRYPKVDLKP